VIVVDTNVIAYCYIQTPKFTEAARQLLQSQPNWNAPLLWRSEFRNILLKYVKAKLLSLNEATQLQIDAEDLLKNSEALVDSTRVLQLAHKSGCTAYDCEFIAAAETLETKLFTTDKQLLKAFPRIATALI
jgi:predicted nucleic acid-binding protein